MNELQDQIDNASSSDYHLRIGNEEAEKMVASNKELARDRLDIEGSPLVHTVAGTDFYYSGCYAYVPSTAKGLEVNADDDKIGSTAATLRAVLKAISNDPDTCRESDRCTVRFAASLFNGGDVLTISLEQAQMTVDCAYPVVLKPPAGKRLVLDGGGKWRALYVTPRTKLILENVTFSNCLAVNAGADAAARTTSGGALVNDGSLVASGCVFSDNAASGGTKIMPAPSGNGGAVLNRGDAVFERCTFARNSAANGGAVCNAAAGRLTVVSSTFTGNHAIKGNSTIGGNGGAIAQVTATSDTGSPDTLLVNCTLTGNAADGDGGGVHGEGEGVKAVIDCTFTNCTATGKGGGIAGVREIRGCRFAGNRAWTSGGGAWQAVRDVIGSVFAFNAAPVSAACAQDGAAAGRFDHCTFYGNVNAGGAPDCPEGDFNLGDDDAEAFVDPDGGDFRLRPEQAVRYAVDDLDVATNALAQGWIGADGEPLAQKAGDWAVMTRGAVNGWDMTVQTAVDGAAMGDTVEVEGGLYPPLFVGAEKFGVTVRAKDGARAVIDGAGHFRGVTDASQGLTLEGLVITNGVATPYGDFGPNGGGYCGVPGNGATLLRCTFAGCAANGAQGGGAYGADEVISSKFVGNAAAYGGGVAGSALVRTSLFLRNRADRFGGTGGYGGGVNGRLAAGGVSAVKNCTFVENTASSGTAAAGLYEGVETYNLFFGCGRSNVKDATGLIVTESPFVDAAAGDWRIALGYIFDLAMLDFDYAAKVRAEGWTSPDGDLLVQDVIGKDFLVVGAYAPNVDLRLQEWIDAAQPGDTILVPNGVYTPVVVDVGDIALVATGETCVIDCGGYYRGVTVEKSGVSIVGFTVRNGDMACWIGDEEENDCTGGAILGDGTTVASNCTFTGCTALDGGAASGMGLLSDCTFTGCTALLNGGAVLATNAGAVVTGCAFTDNAATDPDSAGGAVYAKGALVAGCFFRGNAAACAGGLAAEAGTRTICCTFAGNTATAAAYAETASAAYAKAAGLTLADCVLFRDTQTGFGTEGRLIVTNEDLFADAAAGDWRLRPELYVEAVDAGSDARPRIDMVRAAGAVRPGGGSLVTSIADMDMLFAGAYGLKVENELQDMIDRASPGEEIMIPAGEYLPVVIPADKTGLTLTGTGLAVIDGFEMFRCLTVKADGVTLKGLTFANGWTSGDGGGVCGDGETVAANLAVRNCTFTNCTATGCGGGICNVGEIHGSQFFGNSAGSCGGGASQVSQGVIGSLFAYNAAQVSGAAADRSVLSNCTLVRNVGGETVSNGSSRYSVSVGDTAAEGTGNLHTNENFFVQGKWLPTRAAAMANLIDDTEYVDAALYWTGPDGRTLVYLTEDFELAMTVGAYAPQTFDERLQRLINEAEKDGVVEIPSGDYGPALVPHEKGALTLRPAAGATVTVHGLWSSPALTLEGPATVERLTIADGMAENGGGVCGVGNATVRACVIRENIATQSGGGVYGVTALNCTFIGNTAPRGAAAANSTVRASIGVTADQKLDACEKVDWFTAADGDFTDFANHDYSIPEKNWKRFAATDIGWAKGAYRAGTVDLAGRQTVRRIAGEYVALAGAYAADYDDSLQRLVDFAEGDTIEVPDGTYNSFVVESNGVSVVHTGDPAGCTIDGLQGGRGAYVTGANVTIEGLTFRNCKAENGGGVYGAANLTVRNCAFTNCTATGNGGALYVMPPVYSATVKGCTFTDCAAKNGGGVYGAGTVSCSLFEGNEARSQGQGAAAYGFDLLNCTFVFNPGDETVSAGEAMYSVFVDDYTENGESNLVADTSSFVPGTLQPTVETALDNLIGDAAYVEAAADWTGLDGRKLALLVGGDKAMTFGAYAPPVSVMEKVVYLDWDEAGKKMTNATKIAFGETLVSSETRTLKDGKWYVVSGEITIDGAKVTVEGSANLILKDGASLTITNVPNNQAALEVAEENRLAIYGQKDGTGALVVAGGYYGAGIGGGQNGSGGTVTINGGTVKAQGGYMSAGIGGGAGGSGGTVTINGGMVTATSGNGGAGIGGGFESSSDGNVNWDEEKVWIVDGGVGSGYSHVKFVEIVVGPVCEGSEIAEGADGVWFVTPASGVTEVTVRNLPEGAFVAVPPAVKQVSGVADTQVKVKSGAHDITGAFTVNGGAIALDPNGAVTIGGETIPVKPVIGELGCFDGEPFAVGENGASITIRTIPGLFYGFRRGSSLADGAFAVLAWAKAERTNLSFTDKSQPEQAAFYDIEVRTYVEEPLQSDGGFEVKSEIDPETLTIVGFSVDAANNCVRLKVGAETTANVDSTVANFLNVTVRKGAEVTVKVEHAESPNGPWTVLPGVGGRVTVDRAGADIEVKLDGELPAQGYFRAKVEE